MPLNPILDFLRSNSFYRSALRLVRLVALPLALGGLVYFAWSTRELLGEVLARANISYLLLALLLWVAVHFLSPLFVSVILSHRRHAISYGAAFSIHARNLPARYIPGGIWHTVGRFIDFRNRGVTPRHLTAFVFLENGLAASVTLGIGGASVWVTRGFGGWGRVGAIATLAGVAGLALCVFVVNRWILIERDRISLMQYAKSVAVVVIFWILAAIAFVSYLYAFSQDFGPMTWSQTGGIYLLSWGLGFVAIFAPQGVGVFEVVLASLLTDSLPLGATAALVGGFRIVVACADMLVWLFARVAIAQPRRH